MLDRIKIDPNSEAVPNYIFKRLNLTHFREYFVHQFDNGWNYLLRQVVIKWPEITHPVGGLTVGPQLYFEFFSESGSLTRQAQPLPGQLFTSPAGYDVEVSAAPLPVDTDCFSVNFTAQAPKYVAKINWLFPYKGALRIDITGQAGAPIVPAYVDIFLMGYNVIEKNLVQNTGVA